MRTALTIALALALLGCRAKAPTAQQCDRLLDHFLEVEGAAATGPELFRAMTPKLQAALAAEKLKYRDSLAGKWTAKCRALLSPKEVACAEAAPDEAGMDHCEGR